MPVSSLSPLQFAAVAILPVLFAITVHEVAHGWAAKRFGDLTAARLGRLTLNPLKHIDPVGTVIVPGALILLPLVTGVQPGFIFGWAKPVPVSFDNLRNPKRDMIFVAGAGPAANFLMAVLWAGVIQLARLVPETATWISEPLIHMGRIGLLINSLLMVFNLLPIPPLDGGRVAVGLLPGPMAYQLSRLEPFGLFIVVALLISGMIRYIEPLVYFVAATAARLVGLG